MVYLIIYENGIIPRQQHPKSDPIAQEDFKKKQKKI